MEFSENHKVKIDTLNKDEAKVYIEFLEEEIERHTDELGRLFDEIEDISGCRGSDVKAWRLFYKSAEERHQKDIDQAKELIETVKQMFWGEK